MPIPRPDIKSVKKVRKFRTMGLSFRQISKLMGSDIKQIHRWATYPVGKLSTVKDK